MGWMREKVLMATYDQMLVLLTVLQKASEEDSTVDHLEYVSALDELKVLADVVNSLKEG